MVCSPGARDLHRSTRGSTRTATRVAPKWGGPAGKEQAAALCLPALVFSALLPPAPPRDSANSRVIHSQACSLVRISEPRSEQCPYLVYIRPDAQPFVISSPAGSLANQAHPAASSRTQRPSLCEFPFCRFPTSFISPLADFRTPARRYPDPGTLPPPCYASSGTGRTLGLSRHPVRRRRAGSVERNRPGSHPPQSTRTRNCGAARPGGGPRGEGAAEPAVFVRAHQDLPWDILYPAAGATRLPGLEKPPKRPPYSGCPVQAGELWPETCVPATGSIARTSKHQGVKCLILRVQLFVTGLLARLSLRGAA